MAQVAMIAGLGMMCLSSSVGAALMMGGEEDKTGTACTPEGTPDPNATYKYGANDACVMSCKTGYVKEDGACVKEAPKMLKCLSTTKRDELGWENKGRVKTEAEARTLCADTTYMSLECPTADGFEVWCVNDITGAEVIEDGECMGESGSNMRHCVGPYKWGDVYGGGANRGSLYAI